MLSRRSSHHFSTPVAALLPVPPGPMGLPKRWKASLQIHGSKNQKKWHHTPVFCVFRFLFSVTTLIFLMSLLQLDTLSCYTRICHEVTKNTCWHRRVSHLSTPTFIHVLKPKEARKKKTSPKKGTWSQQYSKVIPCPSSQPLRLRKAPVILGLWESRLSEDTHSQPVSIYNIPASFTLYVYLPPYSEGFWKWISQIDHCLCLLPSLLLSISGSDTCRSLFSGGPKVAHPKGPSHWRTIWLANPTV